MTEVLNKAMMVPVALPCCLLGRVRREGRYRAEFPEALSIVFLFILKEHLTFIEVQFGLTYKEDSQIHVASRCYRECQEGEGKLVYMETQIKSIPFLFLN